MRPHLAAAVVFITVSTLGCAETSKACTESRCEGCCDARGECQSGTTGLACGDDGAACHSCSSTEVCRGGRCALSSPPVVDPAACNERTCRSGCCQEGRCMSGEQATRCGTNGALCESCRGQQACASGRCQDTGCGGCVDAAGTCQAGTSTGACGAYGFNCSSCGAGARCDASGLCLGGSCGGCVDGLNVCRPGTEKSVCGTSGEHCLTCGANETCVAGACRLSIDAGAGCNPDAGAFCEQGLCCESLIVPATCGRWIEGGSIFGARCGSEGWCTPCPSGSCNSTTNLCQ